MDLFAHTHTVTDKGFCPHTHTHNSNIEQEYFLNTLSTSLRISVMNPTGILSATDEAITIRMYVCMYAVAACHKGLLCMRSCCERHRNSPVT